VMATVDGRCTRALKRCIGRDEVVAWVWSVRCPRPLRGKGRPKHPATLPCAPCMFNRIDCRPLQEVARAPPHSECGAP
jgi:hypothetical protein